MKNDESEALRQKLEETRGKLARVKFEQAVFESLPEVPRDRRKYLLMEAEKRFEYDLDDDSLIDKGVPGLPANVAGFRDEILKNPIFNNKPVENKSSGKRTISQREFRFKLAEDPQALQDFIAGKIEVEG